MGKHRTSVFPPTAFVCQSCTKIPDLLVDHQMTRLSVFPVHEDIVEAMARTAVFSEVSLDFSTVSSETL